MKQKKRMGIGDAYGYCNFSGYSPSYSNGYPQHEAPGDGFHTGHGVGSGYDHDIGNCGYGHGCGTGFGACNPDGEGCG